MKKVLSLLLAGMLVLSSAVFTVSAASEPYDLKLVYSEDFEDFTAADTAEGGAWALGYGSGSNPNYCGAGNEVYFEGNRTAYINNTQHISLHGKLGSDAAKAVQWNEGVFEFDSFFDTREYTNMHQGYTARVYFGNPVTSNFNAVPALTLTLCPNEDGAGGQYISLSSREIGNASGSVENYYRHFSKAEAPFKVNAWQRIRVEIKPGSSADSHIINIYVCDYKNGKNTEAISSIKWMVSKEINTSSATTKGLWTDNDLYTTDTNKFTASSVTATGTDGNADATVTFCLRGSGTTTGINWLFDNIRVYEPQTVTTPYTTSTSFTGDKTEVRAVIRNTYETSYSRMANVSGTNFGDTVYNKKYIVASYGATGNLLRTKFADVEVRPGDDKITRIRLGTVGAQTVKLFVWNAGTLQPMGGVVVPTLEPITATQELNGDYYKLSGSYASSVALASNDGKTLAATDAGGAVGNFCRGIIDFDMTWGGGTNGAVQITLANGVTSDATILFQAKQVLSTLYKHTGSDFRSLTYGEEGVTPFALANGTKYNIKMVIEKDPSQQACLLKVYKAQYSGSTKGAYTLMAKGYMGDQFFNYTGGGGISFYANDSCTANTTFENIKFYVPAQQSDSSAVAISSFIPNVTAVDNKVLADKMEVADVNGVAMLSRMGILENTTSAYLDAPLTRLEAAKMAFSLYGLRAQAESGANSSNFSDVSGLSTKEQNLLSHLKANPQIGLTAKNGNNFAPSSAIETKDFVNVLLALLGYHEGADYSALECMAFAAEVGIEIPARETLTRLDASKLIKCALYLPLRGEEYKTLFANVINATNGIQDYENAVALTEEFEQKKHDAKYRDYGYIHNNDGDDTFYEFTKDTFGLSTAYTKDTMPDSAVTPEAFYATRFDDLFDSPNGQEDTTINTLVYCTGSIMNQNLKDDGNGLIQHQPDLNWEDSSGNTQNEGWVVKSYADKLIEKYGKDTLDFAIEWAKEKEIPIFWSNRMNDTHDVGLPAAARVPWKYQNPDKLISSVEEYNNMDIMFGNRSYSNLDYSHLASRQVSYDVIKHVVQNYDVDGIELDFFRHPCYFREVAFGEAIYPENIERMNDFIRAIRKMVDQEGMKKGKAIAIAVKVPDSLAYSYNMGLDLETWVNEGLVDIVGCGGYFRLAEWTDSVKYYQDRKDTPFYACLSYDIIGTTDTKLWRKEAAQAWSEGVTGISDFNFFNDRLQAMRFMGDPEKTGIVETDYESAKFNYASGRSWPGRYVRNGETFRWSESYPVMWEKMSHAERVYNEKIGDFYGGEGEGDGSGFILGSGGSVIMPVPPVDTTVYHPEYRQYTLQWSEDFNDTTNVNSDNRHIYGQGVFSNPGNNNTSYIYNKSFYFAQGYKPVLHGLKSTGADKMVGMTEGVLEWDQNLVGFNSNGGSQGVHIGVNVDGTFTHSIEVFFYPSSSTADIVAGTVTSLTQQVLIRIGKSTNLNTYRKVQTVSGAPIDFKSSTLATVPGFEEYGDDAWQRIQVKILPNAEDSNNVDITVSVKSYAGGVLSGALDANWTELVSYTCAKSLITADYKTADAKKWSADAKSATLTNGSDGEVDATFVFETGKSEGFYDNFKFYGLEVSEPEEPEEPTEEQLGDAHAVYNQYTLQWKEDFQDYTALDTYDPAGTATTGPFSMPGAALVANRGPSIVSSDSSLLDADLNTNGDKFWRASSNASSSIHGIKGTASAKAVALLEGVIEFDYLRAGLMSADSGQTTVMNIGAPLNSTGTFAGASTGFIQLYIRPTQPVLFINGANRVNGPDSGALTFTAMEHAATSVVATPALWQRHRIAVVPNASDNTKVDIIWSCANYDTGLRSGTLGDYTVIAQNTVAKSILEGSYKTADTQKWSANALNATVADGSDNEVDAVITFQNSGSSSCNAMIDNFKFYGPRS